MRTRNYVLGFFAGSIAEFGLMSLSVASGYPLWLDVYCGGWGLLALGIAYGVSRG